VLVGDPQQLQSIEAGAAFRSIHERHGGAEIGEVCRQREDWQRDATRNLATGRTGTAIHAYDNHGMVHEAQSREQARGELIDRWDRDRQASPDASRIILTHTNAEVRELNEAARDRMREAGDLDEDVRVTVERGERSFAAGDRVMFLQNERGLGVKNGTLGTIEQVSEHSMSVRTDDGRDISFDLKDYNRIDHGYAATIHKAQGMTVDRTHVLATPGMDAHGSYVALSRHRDGMDLHYGRDDFASQDKLIDTLSRDRAKDMATDYEPAQGYAERRGIISHAHDAAVEQVHARNNAVDRIGDIIFSVREIRDGVEGSERETTGRGVRQEIEAVAQDTGIDPEDALRHARRMALMRHAHAVGEVFDAEDAGTKASPAQWDELVDARKAFDAVRPYGWRDAEAAYAKDESLAHEAGSGKVNRAIRALQLETEIRTSPERRADRFVERFRDLKQSGERQYAAGNYSGYRSARAEMGNMAMSLERDAQMDSLLRGRERELGISMDFDSGMKLGRQLALSHGLGRGRDLGIGM